MKNSATHHALVIAIASLGTSVNAQGDYKISVSSTVKSSYVGGQTGIRLHDGPVIQNMVTVSRKGTYAYIWVSSPLDARWNRDFGTEIDLGIGHDFALAKGWRLDLGYAYYNLIPTESTRGDLHALSAYIYATTGAVRPFARIEHDIPQNPSVLPGGLTYKVGANWSIPAGIQIQGLVFGHGRAYGQRAELVSAAQISASTSFKLGSFPANAGVTFQRTLGKTGGFARNETVFWLGLSF